jgi:hypothetical protein
MEITKDEFMKLYGDVLVRFTSYYKYTFTYKAVLPNGDILRVGYGGAGEDIYRHEVEANCEEYVLSLNPYEGKCLRGEEVIHSFYEE